jgi:hypothetical protein
MGLSSRIPKVYTTITSTPENYIPSRCTLTNNLHVRQYVKDVLDRLLAGAKDYDSMLPWGWAEEHPDQIRQ